MYIIEDKYNNFSEVLKIRGIEYTADLITDKKIDFWVRHILFELHPDIEKLIIPIRLGYQDTEYIGLRIGLHIRLTKSLKEKQFIPILFVGVDESDSEILINQIKNNQVLTSLLLFTKGVKLIDLFDLKIESNDFPTEINESILKNDVLPRLIIPNERGSGHQLSNEWGAFRLAKFAQMELKTLELPTDLYFKYKFIQTDFKIDLGSKNRMGQELKNCDYLIIDDNADKGWNELMSHIIESEIINKFAKKINATQILNFEDAQNYIDFEVHDLIFLDLRLKIEEELIQNDSKSDLSGLQILKKIKGTNKGIQVIIITASNKAWNMKKLLEEGADGYFIKESIEIDTNDESSKQNYDNLVLNIKTLFERRYLRDLFAKVKRLNIRLEFLKNEDENFNNFLDEIKLLLEQSFDMHYNAKTEKQFAYAYITLYMIIERINKELIYKTNFQTDVVTKFSIENKDLEKWIWNSSTAHFILDKNGYYDKSPSESQKIIAILKQKYNSIEDAKIHPIENLVRMRNHFIHNDDRLNKDIHSKKGFTELFEIINLILNLL